MNTGLRRILATTAGVGLLAAGLAAGGPQDPAGPFLEVRKRIVRLVEEKKAPSVSLAVIRDGETLWEEAFGWADLEGKAAATPATIYPVASVTKPFTSTALMILVERGLVRLDEPANAYLAEAPIRAFEGDASRATLLRILHHTSGLPMFWSFHFAGASRGRPPLETTLRRYGILVSPPGESYNYSNLGYAVLESVIERTAGKPFGEFLSGEVFKPLNMERTSVATAPPAGPDVAKKYGAALAPVPFADHDTRGASAIYATARDLGLFLRLHLGRLLPGQKQVLRPGSIAAMQRTRDPDVRDSSYALGWETGRRFGYPIVTHGGAMDGCRAHLAMIPSEGLAAAVLINGESVPTIQICDWIFAALLPEYARNLGAGPAGGGPPPVPPAFSPPAGLVGTWQGTIKTHEAEIGVRLVVANDGRVELARLDPRGRLGEGLSPLKPPTLNRGIFVVHFPQAFATSDLTAASHRTVLAVRIRGDRLTGEANTIASDMSYSFPSFVFLGRALHAEK